MNAIQISIIIPTLNEEEHIKALMDRLRNAAGPVTVEIIVADGGSSDATVALSEKMGAKVIRCGQASRPVQMNLGAQMASASILYFVHADSLPPKEYAIQVLQAVETGADFGCFRFRFNSNRRALRFNSWCTRIPVMMCRGGDQSLFITRALFNRLNGFDESHIVMEDYDIIRRGKRYGRFRVLADDVLVSARKYDNNAYPRVNLANFVVFVLYYAGVKPQRLNELYQKMIHHPKFNQADLTLINEAN